MRNTSIALAGLLVWRTMGQQHLGDSKTNSSHTWHASHMLATSHTSPQGLKPATPKPYLQQAPAQLLQLGPKASGRVGRLLASTLRAVVAEVSLPDRMPALPASPTLGAALGSLRRPDGLEQCRGVVLQEQQVQACLAALAQRFPQCRVLSAAVWVVLSVPDCQGLATAPALFGSNLCLHSAWVVQVPLWHQGSPHPTAVQRLLDRELCVDTPATTLSMQTRPTLPPPVTVRWAPAAGAPSRTPTQTRCRRRCSQAAGPQRPPPCQLHLPARCALRPHPALPCCCCWVHWSAPRCRLPRLL